MPVSENEVAAIRERLSRYPIEAQADIEKLLSVCPIGKRKRTNKTVPPYTPEFESVWREYYTACGKDGKLAGWTKLHQHVSETLTVDMLIAALRAYLKRCEQQKTERQYYLMLSTFYGPQKRFETYLNVLTQTSTDPDYWPSANKLIRDMSPYERSFYGVPDPLPIELDYARQFGKTE